MPVRTQLDVGVVIRRTLATYRLQARLLLPLAFAFFLAEAVLAILLISASSSLLFVAIALQVVATVIYDGMVVRLVADLRANRRVSVGALFSALSEVAGPLILVGIVTGIGVAIGLLLLVLPGLYLLTIWSVAAPVVILEQPGVLASLARSRQLVAGNEWRVFGVIIAFFVILFGAINLLTLLGAAIGTVGAAAGEVIASTFAAPLAALASAVLYFELSDPTPTPPEAEDL
jgi:hypothetical protein